MGTCWGKTLHGGYQIGTGDILKDPKTAYNETRLRNLKKAKLKQRECELELYINRGYSNKMISQTMRDIEKLKLEIKNLTS